MSTSAPAPTDTPIGTPILMGGSVGTVTGTGTTYRRGVPTPVLLVRCPDLFDGTCKLVGNATYKATPLAMLAP